MSAAILYNNFSYFRVQVIAAEGEQKASRALRDASEVIAESSAALQLRYLQVSCRSPVFIRKLIDVRMVLISNQEDATSNPLRGRC